MAQEAPTNVSKPIPVGTASFEEKRAALLKAFDRKVPPEYHLRAEFLEDPPSDVSTIPANCGILNEEEIKITEEYDAVGLAKEIAEGKYKAVEVVTAFSKRAIIAHQLTGCLTQWFMVEALEQAKQLDIYLEKNKRPMGRLHGVPVSIKDHIPVAGTSSSLGYLSTIVEDESDCQMVQILRGAGAVFYCKTNQPQSLMHLESDSLWGRVLNPFNINLSAGGSTGGEAALIALMGSPLGVGTDIGGSIRCPAAFCGIYGYKPTSHILPMRGFLPTPVAAELNIPASTGPMCRSIRDIDLFMTTILEAKPYLLDPNLVPISWTGSRTPPNSHRLKIGVISNDGFIQPQPPVAKAISWARKLLSDPVHASQVEVKEFKPFGAADAWSKIRRMYWPDGGDLSKKAIVSTGEPLHSLTEWIWEEQQESGMQTAQAVNLLRKERDDFRHKFAKSWEEQDVDVVIGPAFVGPASAHDTAFYWTYTSLYNMVDYPGVVIPTPIRAISGEQYDQGYTPLSDACQDVKKLWGKSDFKGAPINLQLVARRYHDNELLSALSLLKNILGLAY
ncbi:amidase, putative [Talaromyces stipitatus ATCC 10500]|uniref:Amidase, putative n=1 Tax=Talaromyces stipitatus (strain ATCC 10500 / CBS 375.48 / QM 6759 / NRRL 1006) TaxID=441959 RepID=B8MV14_TALSN|nr:amidase, putative [Talaromyces stipitatus ATCC 10500]EED11904.1 amidase, putative [Talaromyces stipitatus ATCC 10500]